MGSDRAVPGGGGARLDRQPANRKQNGLYWLFNRADVFLDTEPTHPFVRLAPPRTDFSAR